MDGNRMRLSAALIAAMPAGPMFWTAWFLAELYLRLPETVPVDLVEAVPFFLALVPAFFIGLILAIAPVLIGTLVMSACAERWEAARSGEAWAVAGAAGGGAIALLFGAAGSAAFALVATSAVCGWLARRGIEV